MKVAFIAGFGPIVRDLDASLAFWRDGLGIELPEIAPLYFGTDDLEGAKSFSLGRGARMCAPRPRGSEQEDRCAR